MIVGVDTHGLLRGGALVPCTVRPETVVACFDLGAGRRLLTAGSALIAQAAPPTQPNAGAGRPLLQVARPACPDFAANGRNRLRSRLNLLLPDKRQPASDPFIVGSFAEAATSDRMSVD
jgi:hypothetical protein